MNKLFRPATLWAAAVGLGTLGTALVFVGVTVPGLVLAGVGFIDVGLLAAAAAGVLTLAPTGGRDSAIEEERHPG
jgi:hypothetical protein